MAYVPVPKDLNAVKTKVLFNLTKRQLVCFGSGAAVGVPLFFLLRQSLSNSAAAICMIVVMLPFFLFALYEKNGLPLEKIIKNIVQVCFIRPKVRPYETDNFYAVLQRQDILDKEVYRIVSGKNKVMPQQVVKSRFLKLNSSHIEYVLEAMNKNPSDIRNIRAYLLTALYNASLTIDNYYSALVNHDFYGQDRSVGSKKPKTYDYSLCEDTL